MNNKKNVSGLSFTTKALIGAAAIIAAVYFAAPASKNDISKASVMILNLQQNSGGTGIVLSSSASQSFVLTNSHVCKVVKDGGLVRDRSGATHIVSGTKESKKHDLCIVKVDANLHAKTTLSDSEPTKYTDTAQISGHPHLLPNVITYGHVSGDQIIPVMTGFEPCNEQDGDNFICALFGIKPVVKLYESTLITATIMPGSSGSGVYNSSNELIGVAFAGSGELGYAWTVPYQNVKNFLEIESKESEFNDIAALSLSAAQPKRTKIDEAIVKVYEACNENKPELTLVCKFLKRDLVWRQ